MGVRSGMGRQGVCESGVGLEDEDGLGSGVGWEDRKGWEWEGWWINSSSKYNYISIQVK